MNARAAGVRSGGKPLCRFGGSILLLAAALGCGPRREDAWTPSREGAFAPRSVPAELREDSALDLLKQGYIRIGMLSVTLETPDPELDAAPHFAQVAAEKGGDLARVAVRNQKRSIERPFYVPVYQTRFRESWQVAMGHPAAESVVVDRKLAGHLTEYQVTCKGEVWRKDPDAAARDLLGVNLVGACELGHLETVDRFLRQGADPDFDRFGRSPLEAAAQARAADVVRRLLEAKADAKRAGPHGFRAWHGAALAGDPALARLLSAGDPLGPAVAATGEGDVAALEAFLARTQRPTSTGWDEVALGALAFRVAPTTAWPRLLAAGGAGSLGREKALDRQLIVAVSLGYHRWMEALLAGGADVDDLVARSFRDLGPGYAVQFGNMAALNGDAAALRILLRYDTSIPYMSSATHKYQPLHLAVLSGSLEAVLCLLNAGASPNEAALPSRLLGVDHSALRMSLVRDQIAAKAATRAPSLSPASRALLVAEAPSPYALAQLQGPFALEEAEFLDLQTNPVPEARRRAWSREWMERARGFESAGLKSLALEAAIFAARCWADPADAGLRAGLLKQVSPVPLVDAVRAGLVEEARILLGQKASPLEKDPRGWTALQYAVEGSSFAPKNAPMIHAFVDHGVRPRDYVPPPPGKGCNIYVKGGSLLHRAAYEGDADLVRKILKAGADLEVRDRDGRTPLHSALSTGRAEVVRLLAEAGADLNARTTGQDLAWPERTSALEMALHSYSDVDTLECLRILLAKGANARIEAADGTPLLKWAKSRRSRKNSPRVAYEVYEVLEAALGGR